MQKTIDWDVYNKIRKSVTARLVENINDEEALEIYKGLTGSEDLGEIYTEIMCKELKEFIDEVRAQEKNNDFCVSLEDYGYDDGAFYIRIWVVHDEVAYKRVDSIVEFLENASDRTKIKVNPEIILHSRIKPSVDQEVIPEKIYPKIAYPKMDIELNEIE